MAIQGSDKIRCLDVIFQVQAGARGSLTPFSSLAVPLVLKDIYKRINPNTKSNRSNGNANKREDG